MAFILVQIPSASIYISRVLLIPLRIFPCHFSLSVSGIAKYSFTVFLSRRCNGASLRYTMDTHSVLVIAIHLLALQLFNQQVHGSAWTEQGYSPAARHTLLSRNSVNRARELKCEWSRSDEFWMQQPPVRMFPYAIVYISLPLDEGWRGLCNDKISDAVRAECQLVHTPPPDMLGGVTTSLARRERYCSVVLTTVSNPHCALNALCSLEKRGRVPEQCVYDRSR